MKATYSTLLLLAATLSYGAALAQLKLPKSGAAAAPANAAAPAATATAPNPLQTPEIKEKAEAATLAAGGWMVLLDRRDWGRAWETSAAMFRSTVPLPAWMDGIPKARDVGDFVERVPVEAVYKTTLEGRPDGEYVTIYYASKFSKKADLVEIVTTVREGDGKWRVTGYSTR